LQLIRNETDKIKENAVGTSARGHAEMKVVTIQQEGSSAVFILEEELQHSLKSKRVLPALP
jgi:hypothetical protein